MEMRKKTSLLLILFFASLSFLPADSFAEPVEILRFEPGDTLEEIRAKIGRDESENRFLAIVEPEKNIFEQMTREEIIGKRGKVKYDPATEKNWFYF